MKIWLLETDANNYDCFVLSNEKDADIILDNFNGKKMADRWVPIEVELFEEKRRSDTPTFSGAPVFSRRAVDILNDLMQEKVEILTLKYIRESYYAINVINVLDCIDYETAQCIRFPTSNRVYGFTKYAFKPQLLKGEHIFKIVEYPKSEVFVSDEFRARILNSDLVGFKFEEVWDSEKQV